MPELAELASPHVPMLDPSQVVVLGHEHSQATDWELSVIAARYLGPDGMGRQSLIAFVGDIPIAEGAQLLTTGSHAVRHWTRAATATDRLDATSMPMAVYRVAMAGTR